MNNLGNTCFFNSVMQCLSHTRPLLNLLLQDGGHSKDCRKSQNCMLCTFQKFVKGIKDMQRTHPHLIVNQLRQIWPSYRLGRQEDSHEFLIIFLESFINSCFKTAKPSKELVWKNQSKTPIYQIFCGKSRSQVMCLGCNYRSNTYEDFSTLSLDLP